MGKSEKYWFRGIAFALALFTFNSALAEAIYAYEQRDCMGDATVINLPTEMLSNHYESYRRQSDVQRCENIPDDGGGWSITRPCTKAEIVGIAGVAFVAAGLFFVPFPGARFISAALARRLAGSLVLISSAGGLMCAIRM